MQIIKSISKTISNLALFIENLTNLGNELVGDEGLKTTVKESMGMVNDSVKQSRVMASIEAREEMKLFLVAHPEEIQVEVTKKDKK
jgi:hypothetical protein